MVHPHTSREVIPLLAARPSLAFVLAVLSASASAQAWNSSDGVTAEESRAAALQDPEVGRRYTLEQLDVVDWTGWEDLEALLTDIHTRTGVSALAAAVVRAGKVVASASVGVRAADSTEPIVAADRFHLGSVTKSFTATVIGKLVE